MSSETKGLLLRFRCHFIPVRQSRHCKSIKLLRERERREVERDYFVLLAEGFEWKCTDGWKDEETAREGGIYRGGDRRLMSNNYNYIASDETVDEWNGGG
jgi:hypothetical protein